MPFVNIKITDEGVSAEQKQRLISGASELLHTILDKDPSTTHVVIDEVDLDNWGVGHESVTELYARKRRAAGGNT